MNDSLQSQLSIADCTPNFWEFIRLLRMNRDVENGFIEHADISFEDQIQYMEKHAKNYRVCLYNKEACGYIGVVDNDLRICVSPKFWGKGVGTFMLEETKKVWPNPQVKIKVSNLASIHLFKKSGFEEKYLIMEAK